MKAFSHTSALILFIICYIEYTIRDTLATGAISPWMLGWQNVSLIMSIVTGCYLHAAIKHRCALANNNAVLSVCKTLYLIAVIVFGGAQIMRHLFRDDIGHYQVYYVQPSAWVVYHVCMMFLAISVSVRAANELSYHFGLYSHEA